MPFIVRFDNPAAGLIEREFQTLEEADARVDHYHEKYGAFPDYRCAEVHETVPPSEQKQGPA